MIDSKRKPILYADVCMCFVCVHSLTNVSVSLSVRVS